MTRHNRYAQFLIVFAFVLSGLLPYGWKVSGFSSAVAQEKRITDRVFLVPDAKSNSIQFQMIVLAGSADESNLSQFGIAHYLEHLVLVGRNLGHAETAFKFFSDGSSNGSTSGKMTSYIHRFPAAANDVPARLDKLFKFYSERLTDFTIAPEEAVRERNVVRQEHDWRYASNPTANVWKDVSTYLFRGHPFALWTIGTPETIAAFSIEESRNFLRRWYRKSNVYFIVTGPVSEALVKETADQYLSKLDDAAPPARAWITQALDLKAESRTYRKSDPQIASTSVTIQKFVPFDTADAMRTEATRIVLSRYLASKLTGSPHSTLVESVNPVAAAMGGARIDQLTNGSIGWLLSTVPEEGRTVDEQISAIRSTIAELAQRGLDPTTVERLKKRYARDDRRARGEPQNAPGRLIDWLTRPLPYETLADLPAAVAAVSVDDVNTMLKALVGEGREAVVILEPSSKVEGKP